MTLSYVIVDLEATCDAVERLRHQHEIIEIGAVCVTGPDDPGVEFQSYVRPTYAPRLTEFCTQLTSITQADVDGAGTIMDVMPRFAAWVRGQGDTLFCSWGDYDRNQLRKECGLWRLTYPFDDQHLNLKQAYADFFAVRPRGLLKALRPLKLAFEGTQHRGIDDARMATKILQYMMRAGYTPKGLQHGYAAPRS